MSKYEIWVEYAIAFAIGLSGLLVGLYVSTWIVHRYGAEQDVRSAQIAVTTALIVVGYIAGVYFTRGIFYVINSPSLPPKLEEVKDMDKKEEKAPLPPCGSFVPPPDYNGGQFAARQTPPCHKWDFPAMRWEVPEYYPQGRKSEGEN